MEVVSCESPQENAGLTSPISSSSLGEADVLTTTGDDDVDDDEEALRQNIFNDGTIFETEGELNAEENLSDFLRRWTVIFHVRANAIDFLLKGLKKFGHDELPATSKTLMKTPRTDMRVNVENLDQRGQYAHYGLQKGLEDQLALVNINSAPQDFYIFIKYDGVSLSRCSKNEMWPISGKIDHSLFKKPFIIGIYHGAGKPLRASVYIENFIDEYLDLHKNGFRYQGKFFRVHIRTVLADTPARNFLARFPAHNSRCMKCIQEGKTVSSRRIFLEMGAAARNEENFRKFLPPEYKQLVDFQSN